MKKIIAILLVFLVLTSCKKLSELNQNIKDPSVVSGESLFTGAQKNTFDQMTTPNVNLNIYRLIAQQWTETTYTDESNYDLTTRTIPDNQWDVQYRDILKDLDEAAKVIKGTTYLASENPAVKTNKLAIVEVMMVYNYSVLVETFGNIPYTQALNIDNVLPKYDDGLTVYKDLLTRLNAAIGNMNPAHGSFDAADNMYANSLKLHMGMVLADVDAALAKTTVEAAAPGAINSNSVNAAVTYLTSQPNANPVYDNLVASGRHDFVPTSILIDTMNAMNDPRRPYYFTQVAGAYVGGVYGASNDFTAFSHVADRIQLPEFEAMIFDYSEVEFLLAEAVERGFAVGGTAADHYNKAIEASILYWGGTPAEVTAYLAEPKVAYATATGDYKYKIGTQQWIAYYNRGFEAWTEFRRLDFPKLVAPPDALSAFPVRFTFPIEEQTLNGANYQAASSAIGGDLVTTKLFWDKH
jgi:hypothetical protein